jgi:hypothetical protein
MSRNQVLLPWPSLSAKPGQDPVAEAAQPTPSDLFLANRGKGIHDRSKMPKDQLRQALEGCITGLSTFQAIGIICGRDGRNIGHGLSPGRRVPMRVGPI